jgi:uncharacterized protein
MKLRMAPLVLTFATTIFAVNPALAQSAADGAQKAPEQHQPGVVGKPAPAAQAVAPAAVRTPSSDPSAKLDPAKDAAIRHLMDITEVSNMGQNIQNYIKEQVQDVASRAVGAGKVQKFMDTFSTQFDASSSPGAVTDAMVTIYAKNFSLEDIQGLIQFYETPLGKRVVKTLPEVSQQSQRMGVEMEQNAAITVLRGMSNEYPEIKPMLPADETKPQESAPAPNAAPATKAAPAPGTPATPKPAPQK